MGNKESMSKKYKKNNRKNTGRWWEYPEEYKSGYSLKNKVYRAREKQELKRKEPY